MSDLIVFRGVGGYPEGRWYDREFMAEMPPGVSEATRHLLRAYPTGYFEVRDNDGAVAEVWAPRGCEYCMGCRRWKILVIHSCPGVWR